MTVVTRRLKMAVQRSGRLADASRTLLRDSGLRVQDTKSRLTARATNFPLDLMLVRDDDIPTFVCDGVCDLGIVGLNVLEEYRLGRPDTSLEIVARLGFGRCKLQIAAPDGPNFDATMLDGSRIATSYPLLTKRYLADLGYQADIITMQGAVELAPRLGIADFVCDLVSSGQTLEANGLKPALTVLDSESVLIRTGRSTDPEIAARADALVTRMEGVIATSESKYIVLNAPEDALGEISRILPGAESPTVMPLIGRQGHVAVQAVCSESVFWETLEELKGAGASAILVMPIEKMMR